MSRPKVRLIAGALAGNLLLAAVGCSKVSTTPPKPLSAEQVAPTLQTAFKEATPDAKSASDEIVSALQVKEEPKAFVGLHALIEKPDLTPEQRQAAVRAMLALTLQMQEAAANGNQMADDLLKKYRATK